MEKQFGRKQIIIRVGYRKGSPPKYQRKSSHKGRACRRGQPVYYNENKLHCNLMFTPTALETLKDLAMMHGISRSEVVERWLRGTLLKPKTAHRLSRQ